MPNKKYAAGRTMRQNKFHAHSIKSTIKRVLIRLAVWGWLPVSVTEALIRWGWLTNE